MQFLLMAEKQVSPCKAAGAFWTFEWFFLGQVSTHGCGRADLCGTPLYGSVRVSSDVPAGQSSSCKLRKHADVVCRFWEGERASQLAGIQLSER